MKLTKEQARELEWFCSNCTDLKNDFYKLLDQVIEQKKTIDRLNETSKLILKFMKKNNMAPQYQLDKLLDDPESTTRGWKAE